MKMENRKRNVQVKFRLTPEENDVLSKFVNGSGMTRNEYIIQALINKVTIPMLSWEKRYQGNHIEISSKLGNQLVGFAKCSYYESLKQVEIHSLFVSKPYRKSSLMEQLLDEVGNYSKENSATSVKVCCGAEPMSTDGQVSLNKEINFYTQNGFVRKKDTLGSIQCLVKNVG